MRALLQRVSNASVSIEGKEIGKTGPGLLILVCAMQDDNEVNAQNLASKIAKLRVFRDDDGKMNRSLLDTRGGALVVSQFTLAADTSRGNRPGFSTAAAPADGERLYRCFAKALAEQGITVAKGQFGADMQVELVNDGPVTVWVET